MDITALGHSAYILSMASEPDGQPVNILVDPWFSDFAVGDLMGRFPRIRFSGADLPEIHGLFLSHAHTDHLDPESLLRLWAELPTAPVLILPASLLYLEALLTKYLEGAEVLVLQSERPVPFRGLQLTGFFNPEPMPSNEDDVMLLLAESDREIFLGEADALLPMYDAATRITLTETLCDPAFETICWLTSRNELAATMSMLAATDLDDRATRIDESMTRTAEEVEALYEPLDQEWEDLWQDPRLVRLIGGQGICYPQELRAQWNRVLFPVRIADRVRMEQEMAAAFECRHRVLEFQSGSVHRVVAGAVERSPITGIEFLDSEADRQFDPTLPLIDDFKTAPLRADLRDHLVQAERIEMILNNRFLPFLAGTRRPPVEEILSDHGGEYRIRIRFGNADGFEEGDFLLSFREFRFVTALPEGGPAEAYWANDLDDLLEGRADEFSLFPRKPIGAPHQRLWNCLGMPYLNQDVILAKLTLHFERAARGETNRDWALPFYS